MNVEAAFAYAASGAVENAPATITRLFLIYIKVGLFQAQAEIRKLCHRNKQNTVRICYGSGKAVPMAVVQPFGRPP